MEEEQTRVIRQELIGELLDAPSPLCTVHAVVAPESPVALPKNSSSMEFGSWDDSSWNLVPSACCSAVDGEDRSWWKETTPNRGDQKRNPLV